MDIIMVLVGIAAIALAVFAGFDGADLPANAGFIVGLLGVGTIGWALGWVLESSNAGIGAWLGLLAAIAIALGGLEPSGQTQWIAGGRRAAAPPRTPPPPPGRAEPVADPQATRPRETMRPPGASSPAPPESSEPPPGSSGPPRV
jgi:hypothetical protein